MFSQVPVLFLLNKVDKSMEEDTQAIISILKSLEIPTVSGIFKTMGQEPEPCINLYTNCPKCNSDDVMLRKRTLMLHCNECGIQTSIQPLTKTLDELPLVIKKTCEVLPSIMKYAFVASQNISRNLKEYKAREILTDFWNEFPSTRTVKKLLKITTSMLAELSLLWEFKVYGQEYAEMMGNNYVKAFTWKDQVNLLMQKKHNSRKAQATAMGILWNYCLGKFMTNMVGEWLRDTKQNKDREEKALVHYERAFASFTEENAERVQYLLMTKGLAYIFCELGQIELENCLKIIQ
eukprot:TRINITY_DN13029_c0_g1_i1.p1 TRINITY_DN13029_c0_g1~~TRINITY_DN13029_c0_g1_i1.p1  ORF type:complete len:292 (-),score=57.87 TRINITY_DN13029_c0_g1_i1:14-889(-)